MSQDDLHATVALLLETIVLEDEGSDGLEPTRTRRPRVDSEGHARALLAELQRSEAGRGRLEPADILGIGGMGEVRRATQTSLGRTVAVKRVRPALQSAETAVRLLQEGWVTGALEHPNIVPVHDLGVDTDGEPYLVLKRVHGDAWLDLIHDPDLLSDKHGAQDVETWHLRVLLEVCQAVAFAHSRGVLHRDLKPENVMVGAYGEVLVMDWGLAVGLPPLADPRLPPANSETSLVGTPAYMAPEMLPHGERIPLSPRTDVFLLGACLFELLTGRPPRVSRDRETLFREILQGPPPIPEDLPPELARICRRAMAREPADRFASVEDFATALRDTLAHRSSAQLAAEAEREGGELLAILQQSEVESRAIHARFGAVQFGYAQALRIWPNNPAALTGRHEVVRAVARWALDRGDVGTAEAVIAASEDFEDPLIAEVSEARAAAEAEAQRVAEWKRDQDQSLGRTGRLLAILISGLCVSVVPLFFGWIEQATFGGPHIALSWVSSISFLAIVVPLVLVMRAGEGAFTAISRPVARGLLVVAGSQVVFTAGVTLLQVPPRMTTVLFFLLWLAIASMLGALVDRRLWLGAAGYGVGFLVASAIPDAVFFCMAGANAVQTVVGVWALGGSRAAS